jgi:hypothetical protein
LTLRFGTKVRADQLVERYPCRLGAWHVADVGDGVVLKPGVAGPSARIYEWVRKSPLDALAIRTAPLATSPKSTNFDLSTWARTQ